MDQLPQSAVAFMEQDAGNKDKIVYATARSFLIRFCLEGLTPYPDYIMSFLRNAMELYGKQPVKAVIMLGLLLENTASDEPEYYHFAPSNNTTIFPEAVLIRDPAESAMDKTRRRLENSDYIDRISKYYRPHLDSKWKFVCFTCVSVRLQNMEDV